MSVIIEVVGYQFRRAYRVVGYQLVHAFSGPAAADAWYEKQLAQELLLMLREMVSTISAASAAAQRA